MTTTEFRQEMEKRGYGVTNPELSTIWIFDPENPNNDDCIWKLSRNPSVAARELFGLMEGDFELTLPIGLRPNDIFAVFKNSGTVFSEITNHFLREPIDYSDFCNDEMPT